MLYRGDGEIIQGFYERGAGAGVVFSLTSMQ